MYATPGIALDPPAWQPAPPILTVQPEQIEGLLEQLETFWKRFAPLFQRREQREWGLKYLQGHLMTAAQYYTQPLARSLGETNVRCLQNFVGAAPWDDTALLAEHQRAVQETLGDPEGCIILDGTGLPRKGTTSVGVARQYCNQTGKIDNCQVALLAVYASVKGHTLLDRQLYVPSVWFGEDYAPLRERCGIPEEIGFQTQLGLAAQMLRGLVDRQQVTFRWVLGDEAFGRDRPLLDQIAEMGKCYFMEVPADTQVWPQRPQTRAPRWSGQGRPPTRTRLAPDAPRPKPVSQIAAQLASERWQRYTLHEGHKGPLVADIACLRMIAVRERLPGPDVWLVLRRDILTGEIKYFLSNAPADMAPERLAWLTAARWPIEQCIEAAKDELHLNQYALRSWRGWYHHVTLILIAHLCLVSVQHALRAQAPALTVPQARLLLQVVLPRPVFDAQAALRVLQQIQQANYAAYRSHRQRTLRKLGET